MFNLFKKSDEPFSVGDLVAKGERVMIVNAIAKNKEGEWKLFVDDFKWREDYQISKYCKEVFAKDYYKVTK